MSKVNRGQFFAKRVALAFIKAMKRLVFIFCMILFLLHSCQHQKGESTLLPVTELQPLSLGMMPTLEGLPFFIADKQGIYDSLGLDLTFLRFNSASDRDAAFQNGRMDGMITDYPSAAVMQAVHHSSLHFVMKNNGYFCFIVSKESRINGPQQLKQRNIAISRNTIVEYATDQLLRKSNVSLAEVNSPEIGQIPLRLQMLQYGQIDASFLPDPFASIAMNSGHRSLISTRELGIDFTGTAFSGKTLTEKKGEIKLLIQGYNLGVEFIRSHPQEELKQLLMEFGIPEKLTGLIALPSYQPATLPPEADIREAVRWLKAKKRIASSYTGEQLVDTTYINN